MRDVEQPWRYGSFLLRGDPWPRSSGEPGLRGGLFKAYFDQNRPPDTDKLNGKPLASGEKVILGAGGKLMGGDQITCGAANPLLNHCASLLPLPARARSADRTGAASGSPG